MKYKIIEDFILEQCLQKGAFLARYSLLQKHHFEKFYYFMHEINRICDIFKGKFDFYCMCER